MVVRKILSPLLFSALTLAPQAVSLDYQKQNKNPFQGLESSILQSCTFINPTPIFEGIDFTSQPPPTQQLLIRNPYGNIPCYIDHLFSKLTNKANLGNNINIERLVEEGSAFLEKSGIMLNDLPVSGFLYYSLDIDPQKVFADKITIYTFLTLDEQTKQLQVSSRPPSILIRVHDKDFDFRNESNPYAEIRIIGESTSLPPQFVLTVPIYSPKDQSFAVRRTVFYPDNSYGGKIGTIASSLLELGKKSISSE